jgi:acylphosphatase
MANKRVHLVVRGRVQGVFFRAATQREARRLGLTGWVKNRTDGSIEMLAEGEEEAVKELSSWAWASGLSPPPKRPTPTPPATATPSSGRPWRVADALAGWIGSVGSLDAAPAGALQKVMASRKKTALEGAISPMNRCGPGLW